MITRRRRGVIGRYSAGLRVTVSDRVSSPASAARRYRSCTDHAIGITQEAGNAAKATANAARYTIDPAKTVVPNNNTTNKI